MNWNNLKEIKYPIIIKPARLGSSIGIKKVDSYLDLEKELDYAFRFDSKLIIQPYISEFKEFNQAAYIYKDEVILSNVEEVFKKDEILSFDDKYIKDTNTNHRLISDENIINRISKITKEIYTKLELSGIVRIDYMYFDDTVYVNEINTIPGSLAYYLFDESIESLLDKQRENSLFEFQNKRITTFNTNVLHKKYRYKK